MSEMISTVEETHLDVLSETRRIIVPRCLCVSERLHDWIARQNLSLDLAHSIFSVAVGITPSRCRTGFRWIVYRSKVSQDEFG